MQRKTREKRKDRQITKGLFILSRQRKIVNVIGDVGGQFDALLSLHAKAPKADKTILVGDLNDRGPKSRQVIEWAMNEPNVITLHSNHGDMFVDYYRRWETFLQDRPYRTRYTSQDFIRNGGWSTLISYGIEKNTIDTWKQIPRCFSNLWA